MVFEGYLELGGAEVLNSARSLGYTQTAPCPVGWLQCPPCDGVRDVLGDDPYTYEMISDAPWHDPDNPATWRFLGVHALTIEGIPDSTREAGVAENILDGGVVGRVRNRTRRMRVRAVLSAVGEDALEAGFSWLDSALRPGRCGTHGDACGAADSKFFVSCPPARSEITMPDQLWNDPITNLAPNPSFEAASGTAEVWRNLATNPSFEQATAATQEVWRNLATNPSFETTSGTVEVRRNEFANPNGQTSVTWFSSGTTAATLGTDAAFASVLPYSNCFLFSDTGVNWLIGRRTDAGKHPVTASAQYTFSAWILSPVTTTLTYNVQWWDGLGQALAVTTPQTANLVAGVPYRIVTTATSPSTAGAASVVMTPAPATSLKCSGILWEKAPSVGTYFDGASQPRLRENVLNNPSFETNAGYWSPQTGATTLSRVTTQFHSGTASLQVVNTGAGIGEGAVASPSGTPAVAGDTWSASAWVKAPLGATLYAAVRSNSGGNWDAITNFTGTGDWQKVVVQNNVTNANTPTLPQFMVRTATTAQAITFWVDEVIIERGATAGTYFDGATADAAGIGYEWSGAANASTSYAYDLDLTAAWTGTANASASTLTGVGTVGVSSYGQVTNIGSGHWASAGVKSLRVVPMSTDSDTFAPPGGDTGGLRLGMMAGKTYTFMATIRLAAAQTGAQHGNARRLTVWYRDGGNYVSVPSSAAPNAAGVTQLRVTVTIPATATEAFVRLYNGATRGNGDVWWDSFAIVEGTYTGPYFDGSTLPAGDFTHAWTGTAHASQSVEYGIQVPATTVGNNAKSVVSSEWASSGSKSIRGIPVGGSLATEGWINVAGLPGGGMSGHGVTFEAGKTYTVMVKSRLAAAQTVTHPTARRVQAMWNSVSGWGGDSSVTSPQAPNVAGVTEHRLTFTIAANAVWASVRLGVGSGDGGGDVWWDDLLIVEGTYTGPYFDGSAPARVRQNLCANPSYEASSLGIYFGFGGETATRVDGGLFGTKAMRHERTTGVAGLGGGHLSTRVLTSPGRTYTASMYVKPDVTMSLRMAFEWATGPDTNYPGDLTPTPGSYVLCPAGEWTRIWATATAPANAGAFWVSHRTEGTVTVGQGFLFDGEMIEESATLNPYFDGATPIAPYLGAWVGSAHQSASYLYDPDFTYAWTGTANASASVATGPDPSSVPPMNGGTAVQSSEWSESRAKSIRLIPTTASNDTNVLILGSDTGLDPFQAGRTYTVLATARLTAAQTGSLNAAARGIQAVWNTAAGWSGTGFAQEVAPNAAGEYAMRLTFTLPDNAVWALVRLYNGAAAGGGDIWWDDVMVVEGDYRGAYFDGESPDSPLEDWEIIGRQLAQYEWTGTPDASTSTYTTGTVIAVPDPVEYQKVVERLVRTLHSVTCVSGPIVEQKFHRGDTWGYVVEFVLVAAVPFLFGITKPVAFTPSIPIVVQDVPFNLVPYPSAEIAEGTVVAATNYSINPSVELGTTAWSTDGTMSGRVLSRSTELSSVGSSSAKVTLTATAGGTNGWISAEHTIDLPALPAGTRISFNEWASGSIESGTAVLGTVDIIAVFFNGATYLTEYVIGSGPASGGAKSAKSLAIPAGANRVLMRAKLNLTSWNTGAVVRLYADAVTVSVP